MATGMKKIAIVGTVLAALVLSAPAYARLELPDGYALPAVTSGSVTRADDFQPPRTVTSVLASDDSFAWGQAGIAAGLALVLVGLAGAALTLRTRQRVAHS